MQFSLAASQRANVPASYPCPFRLGYTQRSANEARRVGGDIVCVNYAADGSALIAVVDLAAKTDAAERQAEVVREAFSAGADRGYGPKLIMSSLNAALLAHGDVYRAWLTFGTAFVAKYHADGGIVYAAAGAEPAILFRGLRAH